MKLALILAALAYAQTDSTANPDTPTMAPEVTTAPVAPTTTPEPAEPTTAPAQPTTAPSVVTTTTTKALTTTAAQVTTTTEAPIVTTTPATATTIAPTPADEGIRALSDSNGTTCIMVKFEATLTVGNASVTLRSNETAVDTANSECISDSETGGILLKSSEFNLKFYLSSETISEGVKNVTTWRIDNININQGGVEWTTVDLKAESIHGGSSYSCITGFTANITDVADKNSTVGGTITMSGLWVEVAIGEAFPISDSSKFAKAESCAADMEESFLVPIVVACALAGLVLAICVAYIIGRRRTYSGYSAM